MRCPRCEFENIPGVKTCIRCGSVMEAETPIAIDPPRAPPWKKRVRRLVRPLAARGSLITPPSMAITLEGRLFGHDVSGITWQDAGEGAKHLLQRCERVLQSLVPGLPWFLRGDYRIFRRTAGLWLGLFLMMVFWYGTGAGQLFRGLTVAVHAMLIGYANGLGQVRRWWRRLAIALLLLYAVWMPYRMIARAFPVGQMNIEIPAQGLLAEDDVVGWRGAVQFPVNVTRGAVVLGRLPQMQVPGRGVYVRGGTVAPVQVIGLPGETLRLASGQFHVDGVPLPVDAYPVPPSLQQVEELEFSVPAASYLVSSSFLLDLPTRNRLVREEEVVANVVVLPASSLEARAVLRWYPILRRGFLPPNP
jgi:hypothetical protein